MVIWALFDDGKGSWNQLNKIGIDKIYSIGINDNNWDNYFKVDLSLTNEKLLQQLKEIEKITGKPDFIVASPPCESWSIADNQRRLYRACDTSVSTNGSMKIEIFTPNSYDMLNKHEENIGRKNLIRDYHKQMRKFINGINTCAGLDLILKHYGCGYLIENPDTSKIWDIWNNVFNRDFKYINKVYYNNWNEEYTPKPTKFCGTIEIEQEEWRKKYKPNGKTLSFGRNGTVSLNYDQKSEIPQELICRIYHNILKYYEELMK